MRVSGYGWLVVRYSWKHAPHAKGKSARRGQAWQVVTGNYNCLLRSEQPISPKGQSGQKIATLPVCALSGRLGSESVDSVHVSLTSYLLASYAAMPSRCCSLVRAWSTAL